MQITTVANEDDLHFVALGEVRALRAHFLTDPRSVDPVDEGPCLDKSEATH